MRSFFSAIGAFFRGLFGFFIRHPATIAYPALKAAVVIFCHKQPRYADNLAAILKYAARLLRGGAIRNEDEFLDLLSRELEALTDDEGYREALYIFLTALEAAVSEYINAVGGFKTKAIAAALDMAADEAMRIWQETHKKAESN